MTPAPDAPSPDSPRTGTFIAVVGASGVGKDSILDYARTRCDALFVRRAITRPPGEGEDHRSLTEVEFETARTRGEFAVDWRAHGLRYGLPIEIDGAIERGRVVVANVSRGVLDLLERRYPGLVVVTVTVSDEVRHRRLHQRGRESAQEVAARLTRADPAPCRSAGVEIRNDTTVAAAGAQLLSVIRGDRPA